MFYTKDELYNRLVVVASQSPAKKRKVGAILACKAYTGEVGSNNYYKIIAEGYNFNPSGGPCETEDNITHENVIHAEVACLNNIPSGIEDTVIANLQDYTMFVTHQPCTGCIAYLKTYNINYEVWRKPLTGKLFEVPDMQGKHISDNLSDVAKTLKERGSRYGDFSDNARVHQALLRVMMAEPGWENLSDVHKTALDVFCQKQARILNGDPNYKDNWHDIGGYSKLAEDRCTE